MLKSFLSTPIESRRDDSQTQLYGTRIVRSADYTEVEILFLCFILVCGSEVGVEFAKKVVLFDYGIAVFSHSGHIVMLNDGISIIFKDRIVREAQNGVSDVLPRSATSTSGRTAHRRTASRLLSNKIKQGEKNFFFIGIYKL